MYLSKIAKYLINLLREISPNSHFTILQNIRYTVPYDTLNISTVDLCRFEREYLRPHFPTIGK